MPGSSDRRAEERMAVGGSTTCSFAAPVAADIPWAKVRDLSMSGVGLLVAQKVEVGSRLVIGLSNPTKGLSKTVVVRVVHVTPASAGFHVGGLFDTPLTYSELTAFVL
jgi:hypothetical protein